MKKLAQLILCITAIYTLASLVSCNNNEGPDDGTIIYYADIVSCHFLPDSTLYFEQIKRDDAGSVMLYPNPAVQARAYDGQRILLQYYINEQMPGSNYSITALQLVPVRHDTIIEAHPDTIAAYPNHPMRVNTTWRTGNYFNMEIQLEYYNLPHRLDLFYTSAQQTGDTIDVVLRHDRAGDAVGYWTNAYASFYIPNLNTYKAIRVYANIAGATSDNFVVKLKD